MEGVLAELEETVFDRNIFSWCKDRAGEPLSIADKNGSLIFIGKLDKEVPSQTYVQYAHSKIKNPHFGFLRFNVDHFLVIYPSLTNPYFAIYLPSRVKYGKTLIYPILTTLPPAENQTDSPLLVVREGLIGINKIPRECCKCILTLEDTCYLLRNTDKINIELSEGRYPLSYAGVLPNFCVEEREAVPDVIKRITEMVENRVAIKGVDTQDVDASKYIGGDYAREEIEAIARITSCMVNSFVHSPDHIYSCGKSIKRK